MFQHIFTLVLFQQSSPPAPVQFLTLETLFSAAGTTTAVITVTSVLNSLLKSFPARWFALALSLCLTIIGLGVQHQGYRLSTVFLACVNGLLIYAAAVGINNVVTRPPAMGATPPGAPVASGRSNRWWP